MPRKPKGPRLYLRSRAGRGRYWVILDDGRELGTQCGEGDRQAAERALAQYIAEKYEPPRTGGDLSRTLIADVLNLYLIEHAPTTADGGAWLGYMAEPLLEHWGAKPLRFINRASCAAYAAWRIPQGVSDQTARHELKTLRAAIRYYHSSEHGPLTAVPVVTLPPKAPQRVDYWLTRDQVAARLWAALRRPRCRHIARAILIGVYTGTRPGAIRGLQWMPSTTGGWVDLESETLHRRAIGKRETRKLQPPVRIHARLLPHLRRWKRLDEAAGITHVVHYYGKPIAKLRNSWAAVAEAAGHGREDGPHICRHTAATWQMQAGTDLYEAAGYLGMSPETLWSTYGHHSPQFQANASKAGGKRVVQATSKNAVNADGTNRTAVDGNG